MLLLPPAAAAAAVGEEEEMAASPGWGGGHGYEDDPRPRRSCEGRQRSDFLVTRTRKARNLHELLPPLAAAAAAEGEEEEMAASPGWGGGHGVGDDPRPRRSCEVRHRFDLQHSREERQRSGLQRGDFLATRMRKPRQPRAAAMEEEEVGASLSGGQRDQDIIPQVLPRRGSEGSPCDGILTRELQGQVFMLRLAVSPQFHHEWALSSKFVEQSIHQEHLI
ncbi:unnamed protein product [Urochloa humidicola]